MSFLKKEEIKKFSEMVYIHVSDQEANDFYKTVENVVDFSNQLMKIDTSSVEPMFTVLEVIVENAQATLRNDEVTDGNYINDILSNAPDKEDVFISVPKVIEEQ